MVCACPFPTSQGSQVFIRQLSEALSDRGHEIHLVTYHFGEVHPHRPLNIHRIPGLIPYRKFRAGPSWRKPLLDGLLSAKLYQVVRRHHLDIIHAHNYEAALSGLAVRTFTGKPVLFHTHGVMVDELHTYFQGRMTRYLAGKGAWLLDHLIPRWADHIIAISPEAAAFFLEKGISRNKMDTIPPGISYPELTRKVSADVRKEYPMGDGPLIFYTGNLDPYQNIDFLLKSFVMVVKEVPEAKLVILTHHEADDFQKLCQRLDLDRSVIFVEFSGFSQVQRFLEASCLAVLPRTSWSGFPIKLLNYMAAGKAVVACEGSAKAIEHFREGLVVKNQDALGFARAIIRLIQDPGLCQRLGTNAREKAKKAYAWDRISQEVEGVYERIGGRR